MRRKRAQQDTINNFWMGQAPETMSVTYSRLDWNSIFVLRKRSQWASVSPFRPFQLLQVAPRFGRIGCRIGFATLVESNE
jgi:hypothetical protein